jgi:hypothetical protein
MRVCSGCNDVTGRAESLDGDISRTIHRPLEPFFDILQ